MMNFSKLSFNVENKQYLRYLERLENSDYNSARGWMFNRTIIEEWDLSKDAKTKRPKLSIKRYINSLGRKGVLTIKKPTAKKKYDSIGVVKRLSWTPSAFKELYKGMKEYGLADKFLDSDYAFLMWTYSDPKGKFSSVEYEFNRFLGLIINIIPEKNRPTTKPDGKKKVPGISSKCLFYLAYTDLFDFFVNKKRNYAKITGDIRKFYGGNYLIIDQNVIKAFLLVRVYEDIDDNLRNKLLLAYEAVDKPELLNEDHVLDDRGMQIMSKAHPVFYKNMKEIEEHVKKYGR